MELQLRDASVRPWRSSDAEALARNANARSIWLNLRDGFPHPYTVADAHAFLERAVPTFWCIEVQGEAAGGIGLVPGADVERFSAELGYWLGERFWGRGIVSEAVAAVTRHAFDGLGMHRVFALPYVRNTASARVLEKAGYTLEARLRHASFKDGDFVDQFLYARLSDDVEPLPRQALTILAVDNLAEAVAFYDAALGWPHVVDVPVYVEMQHPTGQRLGLYVRDAYAGNTGLPATRTADDEVGSAELYFYVHDLDAAVQRLQAAGASVLSPRAARDWGDEAAYVRDPFGHVVVVARPVPS